ncbi:hypothetical protein HBE96_00320 [Clostridium sp. P21]|uniref:Uncharacterized protein n=1 Tax=Clostridium muellerianum TaxID=2716538 RepID=A0A7Y0HMP1_9CLOT|nr:hypothetical protein [Clostridium muellerianum]NMM61171.1 hypothetical protein [Clostridium muellerianum]
MISKKILDNINQFASKDFSDVDVIFIFKIVGCKKLEFYIIGSTDSVVAGLTNRKIEKMGNFIGGTAMDFSKTLVNKWNKLCAYSDGSFKL